MRVSEVLDDVPADDLERLSIEYNVDFQVKKLDGQTMFQLLLFSMLNVKDNSLRVMEKFYHSLAFKNIAKTSFDGVKYNSIRDRLVTIKSDYFEAIFKNCLAKFQKEYLKKNDNIISFDSTLVSISSKLLEDTMVINKKGDKKYVKFSIAFSSIPIHSKVFKDQSFISEDVALKDLIQECTLSKENILVFDRGIQARKTFDEFSQSQFVFVSRLNNYTRFEKMKENKITESNTERLHINHDFEVKLFDRKGKKTESFLRLIVVEEKETGDVFCFLSNSKTLTAKEICNIYKQRWEI